MACDTLVLWSPIPAGSVFKIKAAGNKTQFSIVVGTTLNDANQPVIPFANLVPGPAQQIVSAGQRWLFSPIVALFKELTPGVTVEAWVEDPNGAPVSLPDAAGAAQPLHCHWTFTKKGARGLDIFVAA